MSRLSSVGRQWVSFDPMNENHRRWYADFERTKTWGSCPVRFFVNEDHGDLLSMIRSQLIQYYIKREFQDKICQ
jgi:hypothetical protein